MFRFRLALCLAALVLMLSQTAFGQDGEAFTLEQCLDIALKNNPQLKSAGYQVDQAGANVTDSYSTVLPRITTSLSTGRFIQGDRTTIADSPVGIDSTTGEVIYEQVQITQPGAARNSHSASINYSQTLWDFGRSFNTIKQARSSFDAASANLVSARQNTYATVEQTYLQMLKALKLEQEYVEAVDRSQEQLDRTKSMYEIGSVAQVDVYRSEVTLANDEINLITQKNAVDIARANLNVAMGRDPGTPLNILDVQTEVQRPEFALEQAIEIAQKNNPDLRQYEYDMQSAEYGLKVSKSAYWPTIGVNVSYSRNNPDLGRVYGDFGNNYSVTLGARLDFNIFNGLSDRAAVSRQSALHSIAQENWIAQKRQIELEVKQAYLNVNAALTISEINQRSLRAAEEEFRLAEERYRVGAGTQLEVTDAQVSLTSARVNLVSAKYDAMIAKAQLEAALGTVQLEKP